MGKHIGVLPQHQVVELAGAGMMALQSGAAGEAAMFLTQASIESLRAVYGEAAVAIWGYQIAVSIKGTLVATGMLDDGRIREGLETLVSQFPEEQVEELTGFPQHEEMVETILSFYEDTPSNLRQLDTVLGHFETNHRLHDPHGADDPDDYHSPRD